MLVSFRQFTSFANAATRYLAQHRERDAQRPPQFTKLTYALTRVMVAWPKVSAQIQDKTTDLSIECCAIDKDGIILKDAQGKFEYTKAGLTSRNSKENALWDTVDIEVTPHLVAVAPETLTEDELEAFSGFVLTEDQVAEIRAKREMADESEPVAAPTNGDSVVL